VPLVALWNGQRLESFRLDDEWARVRQASRRGELEMTCGTRAIAKVSPRGMRFFAHKSAGCSLHAGAPETPEHLQAKATLAEAARACGWNATVEYVGPGGEWVADVLIERGELRMALEVQWSPQTTEEFAARTARYENAGIHCRWFLGPRNHTRTVPSSYLLHGSGDDLHCSVPGPLFERGGPLPLADAARILLDGGVRPFAELRVEAITVDFYQLKCWACDRWYSRWWVSEADVVSRCGVEGTVASMAGFWAWRPGAKARIEERIHGHILRLTSRDDWPDPCGYRRMFSQQAGETYSMAVCPHCSKPQGDSHLIAARRPRVVTLYLPLDEGARRDFRVSTGALRLPHLCPDVGHGRCEPPRDADPEYVFPMPASTDHE